MARLSFGTDAALLSAGFPDPPGILEPKMRIKSLPSIDGHARYLEHDGRYGHRQPRDYSIADRSIAADGARSADVGRTVSIFHYHARLGGWGGAAEGTWRDVPRP
jgi:hypothetical protein